MARCPSCGKLVRKESATKIGKRYYGPECALRVLENLPRFRVIRGGVSEEDAKKHSYMRRRAQERGEDA